MIGVEIIENAVEDAKANADLNGEFVHVASLQSCFNFDGSPVSNIQLFAILFKSSLKNSGRRAMYGCPSHEKHTANVPLKTPNPPPPLARASRRGKGGDGLRIRKRCLSRKGWRV